MANSIPVVVEFGVRLSIDWRDRLKMPWRFFTKQCLCAATRVHLGNATGVWFVECVLWFPSVSVSGIADQFLVWD